MRIKVFIFIALISVLSVMFFVPTNSQVVTSQQKPKTNATDSIQGTTTSKYTVGYLYSNDLTAAQAYKNELNKYGWSVELVNTNHLEQGNWSNYKLIMLGRDTGIGYNWNNASEITYLNNLNIPFIALGEGSLSFYGSLGLPINYGSTGGQYSTTVFAYNSTAYNTYFSTPFHLSNITNIINNQLYFGYYLSGNPPSGVQLIGGDLSHTGYYPVAVQNIRYGLWGFNDTPTAWTINGEHLFENLLIHLTGVNPDSASMGLNISPTSLIYEVGTTDHVLQIQGSSINPSNYTIYENGTLIQTGSWTSGNNISVSVDGLSIGAYNFTAVVDNMFYNTTSGTILIQVIAGPTTTTTTTTVTSTVTANATSSSSTSNTSKNTKTSPSFEFMTLLTSLAMLFILRRRNRRKYK